MQKHLGLTEAHLSHSVFVVFFCVMLSRKLWLGPSLEVLPCCFFSSNFMASRFTWRPLIHIKLTFLEPKLRPRFQPSTQGTCSLGGHPPASPFPGCVWGGAIFSLVSGLGTLKILCLLVFEIIIILLPLLAPTVNPLCTSLLSFKFVDSFFNNYCFVENQLAMQFLN